MDSAWRDICSMFVLYLLFGFKHSTVKMDDETAEFGLVSVIYDHLL